MSGADPFRDPVTLAKVALILKRGYERRLALQAEERTVEEPTPRGEAA